MYDKARKDARICIRITAAQHQQIREAAERENRTMSGYLENAIRWWLEECEDNIGKEVRQCQG